MRPFILLVPCLLLAQAPRVTNARLDTRAAGADLEAEFRALVAAQSAAAWIGYAVPSLAGSGGCCYSSDSCCGGCSLEGQRTTGTSTGPVRLEPAKEMLVLFRVEQKKVDKIRTFGPDCELDAGGLPFYWLTGVRPGASLAVLATLANPDNERMSNSAIGAIARHDDPAADRMLEEYASAPRPERLRRNAIFWLGSARGRHGYDVLNRIVRDDPDQRIRERAVFALSVSKEPAAIDTMIDVARNDKTPHVRGQALFWLAQKAGKKAVEAIGSAIQSDPETEVKKRAVFALSQLKEDGVPMLIQVARTNRNPEVRKQAMFWLGQSKDPRAVTFFEEILKK